MASDPTESGDQLISRELLGKRLRLLRVERDLTMKQVEDRTGINEASISRWERAVGGGYPDLAALEALAGVYDVPLSQLLFGEWTTRV